MGADLTEEKKKTRSVSFREGGLRPLQQRSKPCGEREAAGENCKQEAKDIFYTLTHTETKHTQKKEKNEN